MNEDLRAGWAARLMNNYGQPALALVRGEGVHVWDADGKQYLDFLGGIAVNVLGHAHPAVVAAVTKQVATLGHVSNLYMSPNIVELATRLAALLPGGDDAKVFFSNSGAEANEAAFKIARRTGRGEIIAACGGFHGRTMGALALTGQPPKQQPFMPMTPGVRHVPYGDAAALEAAVGPDTAAVFLEPIQGENGVVVPPAGYLAAAREITAKAGALLILDEVQTGMGRTGTFFAHEQEGCAADVVTLAKGLGGGLPIGATIATGRASGLLEPGQHGSTFGGNPVCAAAALAVLDVIEQDGLAQHARALGEECKEKLAASGHPLVEEVRGAGLLLGVRLAEPKAAAVEAAAREAGFLVGATGADVVRLAPPLVLSAAQAGAFVGAFGSVLDAALEHGPGRSA
ncbi:acetylornithine and succinylornithine aminotransferase [Segniliparus rotundus DSM 44985]|uniref:Acetylornithine aminotransferase n=1 Tax=Segniliparus rotundus (strain ATCC BAA-972 / CDC 1076 / CIP 108378 / DSM 44985 / JCM 13578) TaxID=640132 RepID=D6ZET1_SEGRD|nr:acetylornithine transaminase [Segniliparus rotundus]ADG97455.1 acetylornithine and succinylornithine aminotransferase [Segniliparus rotundus DSM 44985]